MTPAQPQHPLASLAYIREALVDFRMDHPHVGSSALDRAEIELESLESALRAQAEAAVLRAEVWVQGDDAADLISVTGCVHWQVWEDLTEDLASNNHPDLPEGVYIVPVERDNTTPTGEASGTYTHYLDWSRAALAQAGGES